MSIVNIKTPAAGVASGTFTLGFTPTIGNTLVLWGYIVGSTNTLTSATLGAGRGFTVLDDVVDDTYTEHMYLATRVVQSGDSSSITLVISGGSFVFYVYEVSGVLTPETSGWENVTYVRPGGGTSFNCAYTTANPNDFVLVGTRYGGSISSPSGITSGFTLNNPGGSLGATFYNPDVGAAGSKTFGWTSAFVDPRVHIYKLKAAVTDPTVTSVTGTTVTEGGSIVYTVTLSGATNRTTNYAASFTGGTATGADYDSALGNATYSAGVTFSGGNMVVPTAVSSFTFTVATTQDTLDEADETVFPTVGGVAAVTGTINDNDAPPVVTFSDGVESFGVVTCVATLGAVSGKDVSFQVDTTNGTKTAGTHYTALSAVPVTILAGNLTATITVNTL